MAINAGVSEPLISEKAKTGTINKTYGQVALAFYYLFNVVYSFAYTPLQGVIPAEALETTTRAKGLALSGFMVNCIGFISQFATPIWLQNISTNYFWIFVGWDLFETVCWYFFACVNLFLATRSTLLCLFRCDMVTGLLLILFAVSKRRAGPSKNSNGYTSNQTRSRLPRVWTASLFNLTAELSRRLTTTMLREFPG
jgi:Na+/melibiose symporter-like transporter